MKAPEFTAGLVAGLLAGLAIAAAVAWWFWPASSSQPTGPTTPPLTIHSFPDYQLSATEHVRAVVIPEYGGVGTLCVVYVNNDLKIATMQCPKEGFLGTGEPESPK